MKSALKYFHNRATAINGLLRTPKQRFTPASFHALRVEIKKLNALLALLAYSDPDFDRKKAFQPFKAVFKPAGRVRELQIEEALLKKLVATEKIPGYHLALRRKKLEARARYFLKADDARRRKIKAAFEYIAPFLNRLSGKLLRGFLAKKIRQLKQLQQQDSKTPEVLHELRRRLKKIMYGSRILSRAPLNAAQDQWDELARILGDWHDGQVVIAHLTRYMEKHDVGEGEMAALRRVRAGLRKRGKNQLKPLLLGMGALN